MLTKSLTQCLDIFLLMEWTLQETHEKSTVLLTKLQKGNKLLTVLPMNIDDKKLPTVKSIVDKKRQVYMRIINYFR